MKSMTILENLYFNETQEKTNKMLSDINLTIQKTHDILQLVSSEERNEISERLTDLGDTHLRMGYINGFRTCLKLMNELQGFNQDNFLVNLID